MLFSPLQKVCMIERKIRWCQTLNSCSIEQGELLCVKLALASVQTQERSHGKIVRVMLPVQKPEVEHHPA